MLLTKTYCCHADFIGVVVLFPKEDTGYLELISSSSCNNAHFCCRDVICDRRDSIVFSNSWKNIVIFWEKMYLNVQVS